METYAKNEIEKKYQRDIEYSLLNGLLTGDELSKAARMLKLKDTAQYCVVSFHTISSNSEDYYTKEELDYIMSLCEKYDLYIMNDEIWSDIVYPDAKFESIYCLGNERCHRVMSVFGYSKSFGLAGLRVGCVYTTNDDAFDKLVEASDVMSTAGGATSISQVAAIAAMNDSRDWGKEFIKHLTENRDYAVNFINNNIPQLHAYRPKATYLLYVDIKDLNCTAVELVDFLKKEVKLSVVPGGHNYFGNQSEGHVRICIATSKGILHEGLNRLKLGVEKFVSQKG